VEVLVLVQQGLSGDAGNCSGSSVQMVPMTIEPTYDRTVAATMIVRLATGEEFEAGAGDFSKFGYVDRNTVLADWRAFVEDATGVDLLREGSELNPLWVALFQALNNPAALTDGSLASTQAEIIALTGRCPLIPRRRTGLLARRLHSGGRHDGLHSDGPREAFTQHPYYGWHD
jgi:hypothetical protein